VSARSEEIVPLSSEKDQVTRSRVAWAARQA
jgi:hypothetical protein